MQFGTTPYVGTPAALASSEEKSGKRRVQLNTMRCLYSEAGSTVQSEQKGRRECAGQRADSRRTARDRSSRRHRQSPPRRPAPFASVRAIVNVTRLGCSRNHAAASRRLARHAPWSLATASTPPHRASRSRIKLSTLLTLSLQQ